MNIELHYTHNETSSQFTLFSLIAFIFYAIMTATAKKIGWNFNEIEYIIK